MLPYSPGTPNSKGTPPADHTPCLTASASNRKWAVAGEASENVLATPMMSCFSQTSIANNSAKIGPYVLKLIVVLMLILCSDVLSNYYKVI